MVKTLGDGLYAVFDTASKALNAALAAQQALLAESWSEHARLRVRMALHTGTAELREGDYYGPTLNRVARLMAIGHGGQTPAVRRNSTICVAIVLPPASRSSRSESQPEGSRAIRRQSSSSAIPICRRRFLR